MIKAIIKLLVFSCFALTLLAWGRQETELPSTDLEAGQTLILEGKLYVSGNEPFTQLFFIPVDQNNQRFIVTENETSLSIAQLHEAQGESVELEIYIIQMPTGALAGSILVLDVIRQ